ncbi:MULTISPECIES: hypothetical protein [Agrobacterium]|uniref:hypothetical protein n=1 Tax=Agrobacterium TaxID=357 RepID=UPI0023014703|nr:MULTISPECIES: hypothetical protein [Agrobacterium]MDA5636545.1 hypothetical protein [Agrobacterium sp. ST15.13.013]MDA6998683.1 hypothetical protein [Agrobacterium salinitolerans]
MAGAFDFLFKKKTNGENDLKAVLSPEEAKKENFLSQFLPEDADKRQSLAQSLLLGGAAMMAAGGPSEKPTNLLSIVGQGLGNGVGAYNANMDGIADRQTKGITNRANQVKLQSVQDAQNRAATFVEKYSSPSENGYSIEALFALHQMQLANGDDAGARETQGQIQKLQQHAADNGMVLGEDGSYRLADGYGKSIFDTKKAESLGSAVGQNAEITADQKDYRFGVENPDFRKYEFTKKNDTNINVNTAPKDGKIFEEFIDERKGATSAVAGLKSNFEAQNAIRSGAITGAMADKRLYLQKVGALLGVADTKEIQNTETFQSAVAPMVGAMIKDIVGSANISDSDRAFAEKAAGGNISLDEGSILRLLEIQEKVAKDKIATYSSRVDAIYPDTPENEKQRAFLKGGIAVPEKRSAVEAVVVDSEAGYEAVPAGSAYRFSDDPPEMVRRKR